MTENQINILNTLNEIVKYDKEYYSVRPATDEQIIIFRSHARKYNIPLFLEEELVELYKVANNFSYNMILGMLSCDDELIFEFWNEKDLWLGQADMHTFRWSNSKYCLGTASQVSYSTEYEHLTLLDFFKSCLIQIRGIENRN